MSKLALVTGASSGIGMAFAQRLAADGYDLVVTGRRRTWLEELAATLTSVNVEPMTADLSTDEGVDAIAAVCAAQPLAMLVNNADVAHYMPFADLPADKASELVHVKVAAPAMLARAAVPGMIARGEGTIINVLGDDRFQRPHAAGAASPVPRGVRRSPGLSRHDDPGPARGDQPGRAAGTGGLSWRGSHRIPRAPGAGPRCRDLACPRRMLSPPACAAWNSAR